MVQSPSLSNAPTYNNPQGPPDLTDLLHEILPGHRPAVYVYV